MAPIIRQAFLRISSELRLLAILFNLSHDVIYGHTGVNFSAFLSVIAVAGRKLIDEAHCVGDSEIFAEDAQCLVCDLSYWFEADFHSDSLPPIKPLPAQRRLMALAVAHSLR